MQTEHTLLKMIQKISQKTGATLIGDDAAFVRDLVISTDQFLENVHFEWPHPFSPKDVGFKGVVQALSDLAAMATRPSGLLVSAALTAQQQSLWEPLFSGIEEACLLYNVPLLGGDISQSKGLASLDFVVFGFESSPITKKGAQPSDLLAVTGPLGLSSGGFYCLQKNIPSPTLETAFLRPQAQIDKILAATQSLKITSLTDISDSLSRSLLDLSSHSQCGFEVDSAKIPSSSALQDLCRQQNLPLDSLIWGGGEDYQLLMTLAPDSSEKTISDLGLSIIGKATTKRECVRVEEQKKIPVTEVGWDPFRL